MDWNIDFISRENFKAHVRNTLNNCSKDMSSMDIKKFNKNLIDPIKMIIEKNLKGLSWTKIIEDEIARQRDKSNTNDIGYFHQNMFKYISNCEVPLNGSTEGSWDIIFRSEKGIVIEDDNGNKDTAHTIYVEMKNKHNTMNKSSSNDTYIKMQNQLLTDDDCFCFLTEVIAKNSQNIPWTVKLKNGKHATHKRIRRVSIDKFYELVTGDSNAFFKICMQLPYIIKEINEEDKLTKNIPEDTVIKELNKKSKDYGYDDIESDDAYEMSLFLLCFSKYQGFLKRGNV